MLETMDADSSGILRLPWRIFAPRNGPLTFRRAADSLVNERSNERGIIITLFSPRRSSEIGNIRWRALHVDMHDILYERRSNFFERLNAIFADLRCRICNYCNSNFS